MSSSFGLIIPGRPVETNFQQVESNKFLVTIPNADSINHVVVFLTGIVQMPADIACCIFFSLPDPNAPPAWHYLGHLTNDKPSAIYRLSNLTKANQNKLNGAFQTSNGLQQPTGMAFNYLQEPVVHLAQIGISIEPLSTVTQMVPITETAASKTNLFTNEIVTSNSPFQTGGSSNTQYVPITTIQTWYENYTRRLSNDQDFWKTLN